MRFFSISTMLLSNLLPVTARRPNIILLLTDDQDVILNGTSASIMPYLDTHLRQAGTSFDYGFVHTPVCCASRASILTGRYIHNNDGPYNNTKAGNCYGDAWVNDAELRTYALEAQNAGYKTSYVGKYLNHYPGFEPENKVAVPPGWDKWLGLVGNSVYYDYELVESNDGGKTAKRVRKGEKYEIDYLPDVVANRTLEMIREFTSKKDREEEDEEDQPFLLVNAWPTPHQPYTPAPWAINTLAPHHRPAPRTPSFNASFEESLSTKHWLMRENVPITLERAEWIDAAHQSRLEALQSVDDHVRQIIEALEEAGELDNTYIFYTSDNGYHLGQHRLQFDKRQLYETDIRVPFLVRGPGVPKNVTMKEECMVLNVDLAPTILDILSRGEEGRSLRGGKQQGGGESLSSSILEGMDGMSFLPCLEQGENLASSKQQQRQEKQQHRTDFLVTYHGEYKPECGLYYCGPPRPALPGKDPRDAWNNTYDCVRTITSSEEEGSLVSHNAQEQEQEVQGNKGKQGENTVYCKFRDDENFVEYYDLNTDPWQMKNLYEKLSKEKVARYEARLHELMHCHGKTCHDDGGDGEEITKSQELGGGKDDTSIVGQENEDIVAVMG